MCLDIICVAKLRVLFPPLQSVLQSRLVLVRENVALPLHSGHEDFGHVHGLGELMTLEKFHGLVALTDEGVAITIQGFKIQVLGLSRGAGWFRCR